MRKSFKDSLKALEAGIQLANTLALDYPRRYGGCLQTQLSYGAAANMFLFLVQWTDCQLAGALGLLRILIHMTYADGRSTMFVHKRKASIRVLWCERSQSCPFCRGGLKRVGSGDLWIYIDDDEIVDLSIILED